MNTFFRENSSAMAAVVVVLMPLLIIAIGEFEERMRQRDSELRPAVSIIRTWVVPLFAAWTLIRVLLPDDDGAIVALLASALLLASTAAALSALSVVVGRLRDRPRDGDRRAVPRLLLALPRLLLFLFTGWFLIAGVWSVDLSAALTALGVTSLVVSFALQDTLSGIASGFLLLTDQPFQAGDWIRTGDLEGRVVDVNWRSSRIHDRNGDLHIVPNSQLANAVIVNYDQPTRIHRVVVSVQVAYSNAPTRAKEMLLSAARATPDVLEDPPPAVRVVQIDDPLMGYEVHLWIDDYSIAPRVRSDFGSLIWYHSFRFDVPLPSPAQDLYLWDGDRVAIESRPDRGAVLRGLRRSALLDVLDDTMLDELADAARPAKYARGETITAGAAADEVVVLESGRAQLVLRAPDTADVAVLELAAGDLFGIVDQASDDDHDVVVTADSDCAVVVVPAVVAGSVISRTPSLSAALEQLAGSRGRRVQRVVRRLREERIAAEATSALMVPLDEQPDSAADVDEPEIPSVGGEE